MNVVQIDVKDKEVKDVIKHSNVEANLNCLHEFKFIGRIDLYNINL